MATPNHNFQSPEQGSGTPQLFDINQPPSSGGIFLSKDGPVIESVENIKFERRAEGTIQTDIVTMSNGMPYVVKTGHPTTSKSDTAVVATTAWFTRTNGFNEYSLLKYMEHGWPSVLIGPEGEAMGKNLSLDQRIGLLGSISLFATAHNMLEILDYTLPNQNLHPDQVITDGKSRGAMTAFGLERDNFVVFADLTAPCFTDKCTPQEGLGILPRIPGELKELGQALGQHTPSELLRLTKEVAKLDTHYILHALATARTLFNGDAGKLLSSSNKDTHRVVTLFDKDPGSQNAKLQAKLAASHPNTRVRVVPGGHLSIPKKETAIAKIARLNAIYEQRGRDGSFANIEFDEVCSAGDNSRRRRHLLEVGRYSINKAA